MCCCSLLLLRAEVSTSGAAADEGGDGRDEDGRRSGGHGRRPRGDVGARAAGLLWSCGRVKEDGSESLTASRRHTGDGARTTTARGEQ